MAPRLPATVTRLGTLGLLAAAAVLLLQSLLDAPAEWALALGPLLWLGGLGVFQARAKT